MTASPGSILSIEDDPNDQDLLRMAFLKAGHGDALKVVGSVREARELLERVAPPRAVLLDLRLPGESGLELLSWIRSRENPALRRVPVLLLTSACEERDRANCYEQGATAYFVKPGEFQSLLSLVRTIIDHWGVFNHPPLG